MLNVHITVSIGPFDNCMKQKIILPLSHTWEDLDSDRLIFCSRLHCKQRSQGSALIPESLNLLTLVTSHPPTPRSTQLGRRRGKSLAASVTTRYMGTNGMDSPHFTVWWSVSPGARRSSCATLGNARGKCLHSLQVRGPPRLSVKITSSCNTTFDKCNRLNLPCGKHAEADLRQQLLLALINRLIP